MDELYFEKENVTQLLVLLTASDTFNHGILHPGVGWWLGALYYSGSTPHSGLFPDNSIGCIYLSIMADAMEFHSEKFHFVLSAIQLLLLSS